MAFYSNGQSESGHAGGGGSSDSDSEEQRFHANVNPSQRHHSSSTSASSSDYDEEKVSTRPAAEKPAATPSLKKKPNSSDRSAVRNQSTPSEPNPNTRDSASKNPNSSDRSAVRNQNNPSESNPNTRASASKPKNGVASKRAKDDAFSEEQLQPQPKKQSASKEKKPAEDDELQAEQNKKAASKRKKAAKEEVPPSNPSKTKPRKRQVESPAPAPKGTPSAKDSQQKKGGRVWTDNDENVIMHYYLESVKKGREFSQYFGEMNKSLSHKARNAQLYEKVRNMKKRYRSLKYQMLQGGIKEDAFVYKSPHEKELYKLCKQLQEAEEGESDGGTDTDKEPKVPSAGKAPVSLTAMRNNNPEERLVYVPIMKEIIDMVAEVTREVKKIAETSEAELKVLLGPN